jgi:protein-S-isoprenylcysteine O-methyltransferase Ste14
MPGTVVSKTMRFLHWFAVVILMAEMPVPIYWLVMHGGIGFWRRRDRGRLPYWVAVIAAWGLGGWLLYHFVRPQLFVATARPWWAVAAGAALMLADVAIFSIAESELGGRRLVGQAELAAKGEMAVGGLYAHVRHPRYLGMMLGVLGVCLLAGSPLLWILAAAWWIAALAIIRIEERELRQRFGPAYAAYAERVPMLLPLRSAAGRK